MASGQLMAILGFVFLSEYDVDDDWSAHQWCDGIERDDARVTWEYGNDVAEHSYRSTSEDGGRHERLMVVGIENHACDVWHSQSNKTHRSTESGGDSSEQARHEQEVVAQHLRVDTEVTGVFLTQ